MYDAAVTPTPEPGGSAKPSLSLRPGSYAICRLPADAAVPSWATGGATWSVTRTPDELSIVCDEERVPADPPPTLRCVRGWRMLSVAGPLDFALTGVLAGLTRPLADAGVSVFSVSTYDTDHLLVRAEHLQAAVAALRGAGYEVAA